MARANLNKSKKVLTSTTKASKYISKRPRICINGPHFIKFSKTVFLISKSCFTMFTFRGTFTKKIWVSKGGFQLMQILGFLGMYFDAVVAEVKTFFYFYLEWLRPYCDYTHYLRTFFREIHMKPILYFNDILNLILFCCVIKL
jgi:hypothetical protein